MYRPQKVASSIQKKLASDIYAIGRRHNSTASIIKVDVSPDMKNAILWVSVYGEGATETMAELEAQATTLAQKLANTSTAKFSPKLAIKQDSTLEYADHINRLLK